jgi:hypothetical protein
MYDVVRLVPFHCTTELLVNPEPYTYRTPFTLLMMKLDGLVLVITGVAVGVATVRIAVGEVLAEGAGLIAVTLSLPVLAASAASSTNVT